MYFDEDGDLAHEFYEEVTKRGGVRKMRKVNSKQLTPQGEVQYSNPRLFDFDSKICTELILLASDHRLKFCKNPR